MRVHRQYPDRLKVQLAKRYVEGKGTYSSLAKEHGLSHVLVLTWVKKYRRGDFTDVEQLLAYEHQIEELQALVNLLIREKVAVSLP